MGMGVEKIVLLGSLAAVAYRDYREQVICVYVPLATAILGLVLHVLSPSRNLTDILLGAGVGVAVLLVSWIGKENIGYGDGMMLMASGVFLGFWGNAELLVTALILVVPVALFLIVVKKKRRDYRLPFLPFVFAAYVLQLGWWQG